MEKVFTLKRWSANRKHLLKIKDGEHFSISTQTLGWIRKKHNYGFISTKPTPITQELKGFENNIVDLIQNIKFRYTPNHFQNKLQKDLGLYHIKKDDQLYIRTKSE